VDPGAARTLRDTYLTMLDKLSRYWLRTEYFDSAIEAGKKILARDPCVRTLTAT